MHIYQERTLLENGDIAVDKLGFVKQTEYISEPKEWWLDLLDKADKVKHHGYTLVIDYQDYQYSLRFLNERISEKADPKKWINRHWKKYEEMDLNASIQI